MCRVERCDRFGSGRAPKTPFLIENYLVDGREYYWSGLSKIFGFISKYSTLGGFAAWNHNGGLIGGGDSKK